MLQKTRRLRSSEVERVLAAGFSLSSGGVRIKAIPSKTLIFSRFAVVVSKKVAGNAVMRNRLRRQIFALIEKSPLPGKPVEAVLMASRMYPDPKVLKEEVGRALALLVERVARA